MAYISKTSIVIITIISMLLCADSYTYSAERYTREIKLKQGVLLGVVVEAKPHEHLQTVAKYLGVPYAAPPTGKFRFMPSGSAPPWDGIRVFNTFGDVCPQNLPDTSKMEHNRKKYFQKLYHFLAKESEDCLFLNIYTPYHEDGGGRSPTTHGKYPVMVFVHGESFEWNSGNPYDGSVLAAYGKVIVVTLNFRLGILGFLKAGIESTSKANFGLIDQIAALLWVRDNIEAFGGDPDSVTMFGHGTGAACVNLLMLSPMIKQDNKLIFQRAILMSGSSLSDWALAAKPMDVTYYVAEALNCPSNGDELTTCLIKKRLQEIKNASGYNSPYTTTFGPVVDGVVVPNDPKHLMTIYTDLFGSFELMYGVTEVESVHLLGPVALTHGMLEKERNQELRKYLNARCEFRPDVCVAQTLAEYKAAGPSVHDEIMGYRGREADRASMARDTLLDMLSDARSAAPMALTARLHAALNQQSYFYVFGHKTASKDYTRDKSVHGDELPYVFGVPLDGPKFHYDDHYDKDEKLLSKVVMTLWCNFAYNGDPNVKARHDYLNLTSKGSYNIEWAEFNLKDENYLYIDIPPKSLKHYRPKQMTFWNDVFPHISTVNRTADKNIPYWIRRPESNGITSTETNWFNPRPTKKQNFYGIKILEPEIPRPRDAVPEVLGTVITAEPPQPKTGTTARLLTAIIAVILVINLIFFLGFYYRCIRLKKAASPAKSNYEEPTETTEGTSDKAPKLETSTANGCNLIKIIGSKSSKSEDTYEAVKTHASSSSKNKLTRQFSTSTIDAHTKVKDWIANEIVSKCSPRFLRRPHQASAEVKTNDPKPEDTKTSSITIRTSSRMTGSNSTLGQSPTRPVSPVSFKEPIKTSFIPLQKAHKKAEKVSVAVDATPAGRGSSVLRQQPIELTKSLDYPALDTQPLRRSATLDDFFANKNNDSFRKSSTSINLKFQPIEAPTIIKIEHNHAKSDPVETYAAKKLKTFEPLDVNVTSRDEIFIEPLSPEESLQTIKRRNFPKVLPDYPGESKQSLAHKRRSMPAPGYLFIPIPENPSLSQPNSPHGQAIVKYPPTPPPRTSSSLGRNTNLTTSSPAVVAQEPPLPQEPEIACNNLFIGPLIPSRDHRKIVHKPVDTYKFNNQPIYDNLNPKNDKAHTPTKRVEPKVIIKPTISRTISDQSKNKGPRVVVADHLMGPMAMAEKPPPNDQHRPTKLVKHHQKHSQIPTLGKNASPCKESNSDSAPSEGSDTGTVVKRV